MKSVTGIVRITINNVVVEVVSRSDCGKLFHAVGPATEKALEPMSVFVRGTYVVKTRIIHYTHYFYLVISSIYTSRLFLTCLPVYKRLHSSFCCYSRFKHSKMFTV